MHGDQQSSGLFSSSTDPAAVHASRSGEGFSLNEPVGSLFFAKQAGQSNVQINKASYFQNKQLSSVDAKTSSFMFTQGAADNALRLQSF
jgi:hypothetical protein